MKYTISAAFVIETEPDKLEAVQSDPLHRSIISHLEASAQVIRAEFLDRDFTILVTDMIAAAPEVEIAPCQRPT